MNSDDLKAFVKKISITFLKKAVIVILIILVITIILTGSYYLIFDNDSSKAKNANDKYKDTVSISATQGITSTLDKTSSGNGESKYENELMQLFEDEGYDVEKYFDDKDSEKNLENFKKILNAEIVTQFPYIDGLSSDKVNGVIRFKRISVSEDGNNEDYGESNASNDITDILQDCLKYASKEDFESWITAYNDNGDEDAKNNAMNSFTMTDDNEKVIVAVLKEAKVETNDNSKTEEQIRKELDETFQNANFTVSQEQETKIYTFKVLETIEIEYKRFIEKYTMPSDFLFNLLTYSDDLEFVLQVADLAYNSTIVVGIYDANSSLATYAKEYTYNKQQKEESNIDVYVPAVLSGYEFENDEASANFELFGNNILVSYSDIIETQQGTYGDFFTITKNNSYNIDSENGYTDNLSLIYEYLLDENGNAALDTVPKDYFINYTFYENMPQIDINIADIWYGYYRKDYYYNEPELVAEEEKIINATEYVAVYEDEWDEEKFKLKIIDLFEPSISEYLNSGAFKSQILNKFENKFREEFEVWFENWFAEEEKNNAELKDNINKLKIKAQKKQEKWAEYKAEKWEKYYNDYWSDYYQSEMITIVQELYDELQMYTEATVSGGVYTRDNNIKEKIYTISNNNEEMYYCNDVAAENTHFSKILQKNIKAYNSLADIGVWLIGALERNENTVNVVEKVKYLLNQAYNTNSFGNITDEDLKKLYTTNSANVDIPTGGNFLATAQACHDYLRLNNYYYSSGANIEAGNYIQDGTSLGRKMPVVLGESQDKRYIDCSAYVTWVLMQTGHIPSTNTIQYTSRMLYANSLGFETMEVSGVESLTDSDINTYGYILVKNGHTEIYAGKDENGYYYTYNAGSTSSIRKEISKYTKEQFYSHFNSDYKILIVGEV